ncbi:tyrosine-type recombinase/integrase [Microbacterium soli]|uniref:Integrase n=1 Tax=Microbacterium soli TaxID=446075 RepID=A0ABP7NM56_9MICO
MQNDVILSLFEQWLTASYRASGTVKLRMRYVRKLARRVQLTLATEDHIEQALAETRELSAETRHSILASWRLFYRWAVARRYVLVSPTLLIEQIPVAARMPRVVPDAVIQRSILNATPRDRALVLLGRYACLRLTEIATLHMRDRRGEVLLIRGKGDKERYVYVNDPLALALDVLEERLPRGHYFPGETDGHLHPQSVHKIIKRVTGWNPHALRHAGATAAYRGTGDLRAVQEMLGHASLSTTQRYLHLDDDARRRVAAATVIQPGSMLAA